MEDPEQTHSDDMNVLNYLLRTVKGLRAVLADDELEHIPDEDVTYS